MSEAKDILIGYVNPSEVFPAPLVAILKRDDKYVASYPSRELYEVVYNNSTALRDMVGLSYGSSEIYKGEEKPFLYGVSDEHILVGNESFIRSRLQEIRSKLDPSGLVHMEISMFLNSLDR